MITFDFDYYQPTDIAEAVGTFHGLSSENKHPVYYAGGTEIISQARLDLLYCQSVIDIKQIPQCRVLEMQDDKLVLGAAVTLTQIRESGLFPFLTQACRGIADRTIRNKITLGGNIAGKIPYREAVLPLLLTDSIFVIATAEGTKNIPAREAFNGTLPLAPGEFLVQIITDGNMTRMPYTVVKKTRQGKVDYPIITVAALWQNQRPKVAVSGLCADPIDLLWADDILNDASLGWEQKADRALDHLPAPVISDKLASDLYRRFAFKNMLTDILARGEGVCSCSR